MARVALLIDRTFDDAAFQSLFDRLKSAGHDAVLVGPNEGAQVDGREGHIHLTIDASVDHVDPEDVDALILPRGFRRDHLRTHERVLNFIRDVFSHGKPAGVLHPRGWVLVRADAKGRGLGTWPAIKRDLVVEPDAAEGSFERDLLIGSSDGDVESFCDAFLAQLDKGPRTEGAEEEQVPRESPHPVD